MFFNTPSILAILSVLIAATNAAPNAAANAVLNQRGFTCLASQNLCNEACHGDCWNIPDQKTNGQSTPWCCY
ncbi:hypothetical protein Vi05172_g8208 [Venturia inaequalis]|nr:hypothetical protein Vi05172_g8208 [Venturia inaequalis]